VPTEVGSGTGKHLSSFSNSQQDDLQAGGLLNSGEPQGAEVGPSIESVEAFASLQPVDD
jgi:hypothetical protein